VPVTVSGTDAIGLLRTSVERSSSRFAVHVRESNTAALRERLPVSFKVVPLEAAAENLFRVQPVLDRMVDVLEECP